MNIPSDLEKVNLPERHSCNAPRLRKRLLTLMQGEPAPKLVVNEHSSGVTKDIDGFYHLADIMHTGDVEIKLGAPAVIGQIVTSGDLTIGNTRLSASHIGVQGKVLGDEGSELNTKNLIANRGIQVGTLDVAKSMACDKGDVSAQMMYLKGESFVQGNVKTTELYISGQLTCQKDVIVEGSVFVKLLKQPPIIDCQNYLSRYNKLKAGLTIHERATGKTYDGLKFMESKLSSGLNR